MNAISTNVTAQDASPEQALHAALERLRPVAPEQVARARRELAATLGATRASKLGDRAWSASCLTPSRFPVEIALTSRSDELRTVVEVVAPEDDRAQALSTAVAFSQQFGSVGLNERTGALLAQHLSTFAPRFGAWLGSRHTTDATRHKVYVEVGADQERALELVDAVTASARELIRSAGAIRFLGFPVDGTDDVEIYLRPRRLDEPTLRRFLGNAGLGEQTSPMIDALSFHRERPGSDGFASRNHALSLSISAGAPNAAAAFTFAHHRYGNDVRARRAVLARALVDRWPSAAMYARLSHPLKGSMTSGRRGGRGPAVAPCHGALSVVATFAADRLERHVGMSPPASRRIGVAAGRATPDPSPIHGHPHKGAAA